MLAGITTSSMYLLDFVGESDSKIRVYNKEGMGFAYVSDGEYLVQGTDINLLTFGGPKTGGEIEISAYEKEYLHVTFRCSNTGGEDGYVDLPLLGYTGYRAYAEGSGERLEVGMGDNNVVRVVIPAHFEDGVEVGFVPPLHWRAGEAVSVLFWLGMAAGALVSLRKRRAAGCGI